MAEQAATPTKGVDDAPRPIKPDPDGPVVGGGGEDQRATDAKPARGAFRLIAGYVDDGGVLHQDIDLDEYSGREEDMLGNKSVPVTQRMTSFMASCVRRIGTITDKGLVHNAIRHLTLADRLYALILLRRLSHSDIYDMSMRCPFQNCDKEGTYTLDLNDIEVFPMDDPTNRVFEIVLPSGKNAVWRVATGVQEEMFQSIPKGADMDAEGLTVAILGRLVSIDDYVINIRLDEALDHASKKLKAAKRIDACREVIKGLKARDREALRTDFFDKEPGIDLSLEIKCQHCHREFESAIDVGQDSFFFPTVTSRRSKRRSST